MSALAKIPHSQVASIQKLITLSSLMTLQRSNGQRPDVVREKGVGFGESRKPRYSAVLERATLPAPTWVAGAAPVIEIDPIG